MTARLIELRLAAGLASATLVGPAVRGIAESAGATRERATEIGLCCQEAAVNAVEHALGNAPDAEALVAVSVSPGTLEARVKDRGRPMEPGRLEKAAAREVDPLAERGRGLAMIARLADEAEYRATAEGNEMRMAFRMARAGS